MFLVPNIVLRYFTARALSRARLFVFPRSRDTHFVLSQFKNQVRSVCEGRLPAALAAQNCAYRAVIWLSPASAVLTREGKRKFYSLTGVVMAGELVFFRRCAVLA